MESGHIAGGSHVLSWVYVGVTAAKKKEKMVAQIPQQGEGLMLVCWEAEVGIRIESVIGSNSTSTFWHSQVNA